MYDHGGDDEFNNFVQQVVLLQFLIGQPTAIPPGSLRYIAPPPPKDEEKKNPEVKVSVANDAISPAFRNYAGLLRWMQHLSRRLVEALKTVFIVAVLVIPFMIGPLPYIGGKNRIAKQIIALFPEHKTYVEPFAGGAQVFFHKEPSEVEVLNDLDGELINFFRVLQNHYEELLRYLRFTLPSRKWFDVFQMLPPEALTDIQRAARYFFLKKSSFAGLGKNYHYHLVQTPTFNPGRLPELFEKVHKRLEKVQIECSPYEDILKRYDRPQTLFFLDPPYWGLKLYRYNFSEDDFRDLELRLRHIRGKFVLSLNDLPEVRTLFHHFEQKQIQLAYTAQKQAGRRYSELLITNFVPPSGTDKPPAPETRVQ